MICTEEEAKTKWCPQVCLGSEYTGLGSLNRDCTGKVIPALCIGSACMMWVWIDGATKSEYTDEFVVVETPIPPSERRGTCGLIQRGGQ